MPSDWIQSKDAAFQSQVKELVAIIASHAETWGLRPEDLCPLQQCQAAFDEAMAEQSEQATLYHAAVARKQSEREEMERELRSMVRRINNHPAMTDELRQRMNLTSPTRAKAK